MTLPTDPQRLSAVVGFVAWRRSVERILRRLDDRVSRTGTGEAVVWTGGALPPGLLPADGALLNVADYPRLYGALGTTYNTGGETAGVTFRAPNFTTAPEHGTWVIRT